MSMFFDGGGVQIIIIIVFALVAYFAWQRNKVRIKALRKYSDGIGFNYYDHDALGLHSRIHFINRIKTHDSPKIEHILAGKRVGRDVMAFDYSHMEGSGKNRHRVYFCAACMVLTKHFQELVVRRENVLDKIGKAVGIDDINFENYEFSKKYNVQCGDKKFAYDIMHPRSMELLLKNPPDGFEIERNIMFIWRRGTLKPGIAHIMLGTLERFQRLFPAYLLKGS